MRGHRGPIGRTCHDHPARRAAEQPPRRDAPRPDEAGPLRRPADASTSATPTGRASTARRPPIILQDELDSASHRGATAPASRRHLESPDDHPLRRTPARSAPPARRPVEFESDAYATDYVPEAYEPSRRYGNGGNGGRRGGRGAERAAGASSSSCSSPWSWPRSSSSWPLTALRPLVNNAILAWAADSPAALRSAVRGRPRPRGPRRRPDRAGLRRPGAGRVHGRGRRHGQTIAARLEEEGLISDPRAFVFIASDREI